VLPVEGTYPDSELEFSSAFKADLAKAHLFIQLLSPVDEAIRSKDGKSSRARLQYSLAMNDARQIPIMQWRKPGIRPEALVHWDKELLDGPHVMVVGLEEFKREIERELTPPPVRTMNGTPKPYIYITVDDPDLSLALKLKELVEGPKLSGNCEIISAI